LKNSDKLCITTTSEQTNNKKGMHPTASILHVC
jgi:hypothetical protein